MWSASSPYSTHVPGSSSRSSRSRTVQLAERALALDELLAAHLERALLARGEVADERTPVVHVGVGHRSASLPLRRALLGERGDALGRVLGLRRDRQHRPGDTTSAASASISSTR